MNTHSSTQAEVDRPILRSFVIILRHWRFLSICFFSAAIVAGIYAFTIPNSFKATASFLPPQRQSRLIENISSGLSTTLKSFGLSKMSNAGNGIYSYLSILQSKKMGERIIKKFDLMKMYDISSGSMEKALQQLAENTEFTFEEEGHLTINVDDVDPKRAADMTNSYLEYLNEINTELNVREARFNRIYIEQQYHATLDTLQSIEKEFVTFQKRTKLYSLPDQVKAALTASANLKAQLLYQRVAVSVAEKMFGEEDADVLLAKTKLQEMEKSINNAQSGKGLEDILPPVKDMPAEGLEYMSLYRDYEIFSKLLGFLLPMFQQAKIDEVKESQAVVVLDRAVAPEKKSKPKRSIIIGVSALSVLIVGIIFVLLRERFSYYKKFYPSEWGSIRESFRLKKST